MNNKKWIAVFPGQGSQVVGMGKSLFENFNLARLIFEEASDSISVNLKKLCFDGPSSDLTLTQNAQPCLVTASVAAYKVFESVTDSRPVCVAGHSLGEYSALVANGALSLSQAVRFVRKRGQAMQEAVPAGQGSMAAIMGLEDSLVAQLCKEAQELAHLNRASGRSPGPDAELTTEKWAIPAVCEPANYNAPSQVVIAGSLDAIQCALDLLKKSDTYKGAKGIPLQVSAPFHSSLMAPARETMAQELSGHSQTSRDWTLPYISNCTGRLNSEPNVVFELLTDQINHPVLWKQSMQTAHAFGIEHLIEFGPGKVLQGLAKRCQPTFSFQGVSDVETLKGVTS